MLWPRCLAIAGYGVPGKATSSFRAQAWPFAAKGHAFAYADGATFHLARSEPEKTSSGRMALGGFVWRMADGSDALCEDCLGPSSYAEAQGLPVRVWGMLANGVLTVSVLPASERMAVENYVKAASGPARDHAPPKHTPPGGCGCFAVLLVPAPAGGFVGSARARLLSTIALQSPEPPWLAAG